MPQDRRRIYLRYNSEKEDSVNDSIIEILYLSDDSISEENYKILKSQFREYLNNCESNDIVEITGAIKDMLKDFNEKVLTVSIRGEKLFQTVEYKQGLMCYSHISEKDWNDIVSVISSNRMTDIHYKKSNTTINSDESICSISDGILDMMKKVQELKKMEKKKENKFLKKL